MLKASINDMWLQVQQPKMILIIFSVLAIGPVAAYGAPGDSCFEQPTPTCIQTFIDDGIYNGLLEAYDPIFGDLTITIVWGIFLSILWHKVQNTQLVAVVGLATAGVITGIHPEALRIGFMFVFIGLGITLFQLLQQKIKYPQ